MNSFLQNRWFQGGVVAAVLGIIAFAYTSTGDEATQETAVAADQPAGTADVVQVNSSTEVTPAAAQATQEQTVENKAETTDVAATEND